MFVVFVDDLFDVGLASQYQPTMGHQARPHVQPELESNLGIVSAVRGSKKGTDLAHLRFVALAHPRPIICTWFPPLA